MALKTTTYTVENHGRDNGKKFMITEMSARKADKWATVALFAITKGEVVWPDGMSTSGMAGLAKLGLRYLLLAPVDMVEPLLEELMKCIKYIPSEGVVRDLFEHDIEEPSTYAELREQAFELMISFFREGSPSTLESKSESP